MTTTAESSEAYLGIESKEDVTQTELRGDSDPLQIGTLYNNVGEQLEIQDIVVYSIGSDDVSDDTVAVADPNPGTVIEANGSAAVEIECADDANRGEQEVVIRVEGVSGETVSISKPTFSATVDVQCGKGQFAGSANVSVSDIGTEETTQNVSFDVGGLKNNDVATVNFTEPQRVGGVDYSEVSNEDLTIRSQSHDGDVAFDSETSLLTYSPQGNEDDEIIIEIADIDASGQSGETYAVTYSDTADRGDGTFFEIS
ncbi:hypothetical protein [Natronorubrum sp. DTA28]|uniref:hypothetical protein n=1 Tax=Natronorubrum sp. DTA28 TaxID=3447019 RepID=UPI003F87CF57